LRVGWRKVELDRGAVAVRLAPGVQLDLGGIAKGYIIGAALDVLRSHGVPCALIEAGGDVIVGDAPPGRDGWTIQVRGASPDFARRAAALKNAAIATSGASEQFVEIGGVRYSHVVDPRSGLGLTSSHVVSVIAENAALADAIATALGVMGHDRAAELLQAWPGIAVDFRHP
jgi:thiamine biosynthesis lipoprotein